MKRQHIALLFVASALLLQACGAGVDTNALVNTAVAQTAQISQLQTAAAGGGQAQATNTVAGVPSSTPLPGDTATPSFTATSSIPFVSVSQNTNCRTGPSQFYGLVTTITTGQQVEVLKTFSGSYVVVRNPNGSGDCWLWLQYANTTNFASYNLPAATQPPTPAPTATPTPSFNWAGNWNAYMEDGVSVYTASMSCSVSGNNITCNATLNPGALPYTFSGSISGNLQTAGGTFTGSGGASGDWDAQIKSGNLNQFIGNLDSGTWSFCGARSGSSLPSPCEWP